MFKLIFSGVFLLLFLLALLVGMLKGRKYVWQFSASRMIIALVSAVLSTLFSALTAWGIASVLTSLAQGLLESTLDGNTSEIITRVASAPDALRAILSMIIAPLIFLPFFGVIRGLLTLLKAPLCKLLMLITGAKTSGDAQTAEAETESTVSDADVDEENVVSDAEVGEENVASEETEEIPLAPKKKKKYWQYRSQSFDVVGAICGALCSLFVMIVCLVPMVGTFKTANSVLQSVKLSGEDAAGLDIVWEISDAAAENIGSNTVDILGGRLIYNGLTTYKINGRSASFNREVAYFADMGNVVIKFAEKGEDKSEAAQALKDTQTSFDMATMTPMLISDLLSAASDNWSRGEDFCGMACPSMGEDFEPVVQDLMLIMKDSTYETISGDYKTITNSIAIIIENDLMNKIKSTEGMQELFRNEELVADVILELFSNERTVPMVESFTDMGVSLMAKGLGVSEDDTELYDAFIAEMSEAYTETIQSGASTYDTLNILSDEVAEIYDEYGIELTGGVPTCIAATMMAELESGDKNEVKKFFAEDESKVVYLSTTANEPDEALSLIDGIAEGVNKDMNREQIAQVVSEELKATEGIGELLSEEEIAAVSEDIANSIYRDATAGELKYKSAVFSNADEYGALSQIVTRADLSIDAGAVENIEAEAKALAKVFSSSIALIDDISEDGFNVENVVKAFGPVFDTYASSHTIGAEQTSRLITAILQSENIRSNIGMTLIQATNVAKTITDGAARGESYESLMKSLGNTVEVIKISSEDGDATEAITALIQDLTPTSAEALQQMSTPETIKKHGVSGASAEPVADMMSDMFGNMSSAKENGMTDEQYDKEAIAVNDMMSIAMSASRSESKSTFGEDSATGITAAEFVERASDSVIISQTIVNTVYGKDGGEEAQVDPLSSNRQLSEEERTELVEALDAKWKAQLQTSDDEAANAECQKVLTSIASIVNINVSVSGDSIVEVPAVTE